MGRGLRWAGRPPTLHRTRTTGSLPSTGFVRSWFDPLVFAKGVFVRYWLPVLIWMGIIFGGSSDLMSSQRTSRFIGPILRWIVPGISDESVRKVQLIVRKGAHFTEYAVLSALFWRALRKPVPDDPRPWSWRQAFVAAGLTCLYAVTDEFHQSFVASRMAAVGDVLLDTCGAVAGLVGLWWIGRRLAWW